MMIKDSNIHQKKNKKSIWWRIIDDIIREYLSEEDFLELQEVLANAEKCLRDLSKNHELGAKESWDHEFSLCERAGSVIDNTMKIFSNTLKVKKH
ncbi:hypothetical protein RhiirA4_450603 [Rhizophagus irregularis]|uniref:Uncharacterized protein n=1 Tax=Rhizophagus irregularis TaxID=588596 RepID=A0A2I1FTK1_9GLOM|nr:hypothetical protein RhiirA4_450603 [Rhizophagus irregularis]